MKKNKTFKIKSIGKITTVLTLILVFTLALPLLIHANSLSATNRVTITGRGVINAPADNAQINFCIESTDYGTNANSDALTKNLKIVEQIKDKLSKYGNVSQGTFYVYKAPDGTSQTISRCMVIETQKLDKTDEISRLLIELGATSVNNVMYTLKNPEKYEKEAMQIAINDATKKASYLGLDLQIDEINITGCYNYFDTNTSNEKPVTVSCDISVTFKTK